MSLPRWFLGSVLLPLACGRGVAPAVTAVPVEPEGAPETFTCAEPSGEPIAVAETVATAEKRDFPSATCRALATDLLGKLTLDEKIGQMTQPNASHLRERSLISTRALGSVLCGGDEDPPHNDAMSWARLSQELHKGSLAHRLRIPILFGVDAVHGHNNVEGAVIFPHNVGLGAARDPDLVRRIGRITAAEARATGIDWAFSPVLAAARDERWGRTYEAFGETTELANLLAPPLIEGLQGEKLAGPTSVLACAKHFVADGHTQGGDDRGDARLGGRQALEPLLETYRLAIAAKVGSMMVSFSAVDSVRMHCNGPLLTDVLKRELGFSGFLVSDWSAVQLLPGPDYASKLERSVNAGLDMIMNPEDFPGFDDTLRSLVPERVPMARVDDAVFRILAMKCEAGLFEPSRFRLDRSGQPEMAGELLAEVGSEEHRAVAREAVRKSLVLLRNQGGALPLDKTKGSVLIAGKDADDLGAQCGGWTISWQGQNGPVTRGTTIRQAMEAAAKGASIRYARDASGPKADTAVVVIGERPYAEGAGDDEDLALDAEDVATVKAARANAARVVVVLVTGRPLILGPILQDADAILVAWLPGTEGAGVADVLFGDHLASGKLPHSWPRDLSQVPINVGDAQYDPLFPYGFGLGYAGPTTTQSAGVTAPSGAVPSAIPMK